MALTLRGDLPVGPEPNSVQLGSDGQYFAARAFTAMQQGSRAGGRIDRLYATTQWPVPPLTTANSATLAPDPAIWQPIDTVDYPVTFQWDPTVNVEAVDRSPTGGIPNRGLIASLAMRNPYEDKPYMVYVGGNVNVWMSGAKDPPPTAFLEIALNTWKAAPNATPAWALDANYFDGAQYPSSVPPVVMPPNRDVIVASGSQKSHRQLNYIMGLQAHGAYPIMDGGNLRLSCALSMHGGGGLFARTGTAAEFPDNPAWMYVLFVPLLDATLPLGPNGQAVVTPPPGAATRWPVINVDVPAMQQVPGGSSATVVPPTGVVPRYMSGAASLFASYKGDGSPHGGPAAGWALYFGRYDGTNGDSFSYALFDAGNLAAFRTIPPASITGGVLVIQSAHTNSGGGGVVRVYATPSTAPVGVRPSSNAHPSGFIDVTVPRSGTVQVALPLAWAQAFASGQIGGFGFQGRSSSINDYGYLARNVQVGINYVA